MIRFLIPFLLFSSTAFAGISVCTDVNSAVTSYNLRGGSVTGCNYYELGKNNVDQTEYNRITTLFRSIPRQHIKVSNGSPVEMTTAEETAVDDAMAAALTSTIRTNAKAEIDNFTEMPLFHRALADIIKDEINTLRAAIPHPITSITRASTTGTVTTPVAHGLSTGDSVTISGATLAAYNVTATVTVTSATTFTYTVSGSPTSPAAGSISFTMAPVGNMAPRTLTQLKTAIKNRVDSGAVDS